MINLLKQIFNSKGDEQNTSERLKRIELKLADHSLWLASSGRMGKQFKLEPHENLQFINLRGADLRGANLGETNLIDVDFRGANLSGVDLAVVAVINNAKFY